jgi:hypothetical protein
MERWRLDLDRIRKNWDRIGHGAKRQEEPEHAENPAEHAPLDLAQIRDNWERLSADVRGSFQVGGEPRALEDGGAGRPLPEALGPDAPILQQDPARVGGDPQTSATGASLPGGRDPDPPRGATPYRFAPPQRSAMPSRFAQVEAPRDPYPAAQTLLVRVRTLVHRQLTAYEPLLAPFLDEAEQIIQSLAAKPGGGESPPVDKKQLRTDLDRTLGDLEDMIALWSGIGR